MYVFWPWPRLVIVCVCVCFSGLGLDRLVIIDNSHCVCVCDCGLDLGWLLCVCVCMVWYGMVFIFRIKNSIQFTIKYVILKTAGFALLSKYLQSIAGFQSGPGYNVIRMHINSF